MALVIQLVDRMCNDCFKLKHLFLLSLDLVDILVKNVDELGSEHHVRTHINEPPCSTFNVYSPYYFCSNETHLKFKLVSLLKEELSKYLCLRFEFISG